MNAERAREWLDRAWAKALKDDVKNPDPEVDRLINSNLVSIRYAVLTQLLGKIADQKRSLLALQLGDGRAGAWDPRSFATAVIVPWVAANNDVMGTTPDPYVNNPLRRSHLERDAPRRRNQDEWNALHDFLLPLDDAPRKDIKAAFRRCLASVARRMAGQSFKY